MTLASDVPVRDYMSVVPVSIGHDQSLSAASARMREHSIRHLPVLEGGRLLGIISERDIHWLASLGVDTATIPVTEAMSEPPFAVPPDAPIATVVREMHRNKYGATIVVDDDRPIGIFTSVDALRVCGDALERPTA